MLALVFGPVAVYVLWLLYLSVMSLKGAQVAGKLSKTAYYLGLPILAVGYITDFLVNIIVCTALFLEPPRELLVTARVSRLKYNGTGYRQRLANWFCTNLLDPFDPSGCHCNKPN